MHARDIFAGVVQHKVVACDAADSAAELVEAASHPILGLGVGENFFASDVTALVSHTKNMIYLEEGEFAEITPATAYAALVFSKYMPEANDNSKYPPQFQMFLAGSESAAADTLIQLASKWYLVKQSYLSTSGLRVALVNEVEEPSFETVTFGSRTYDPIADAYSSATSSTRIFRIKWSESFTYLSKASEGFERGDIQMFMLKTMAPKPSDTLALSDGTWRILSVQDEGGAWRCHGRRA